MADTGIIISWRVPREVDLIALRNALRNANLSEDLAGDMTPVRALRRALREMAENKVIAQLERDGDKWRFQLTDKVEGINRIDYQFNDIVTIDDKGNVDALDYSHRMEAIRLINQHMGKRITGDLTRLIQRIIDLDKSDLVPIREQGGAYFIPNARNELALTLTRLLSDIGGRLSVFGPIVFNNGGGVLEQLTHESLAANLAEYLAKLVDDFRADCADIDEQADDRVVSRRLKRIAQMREKIDGYRVLLGGFAGMLDGAVNEAQKDLATKLLGISEREPEPCHAD